MLNKNYKIKGECIFMSQEKLNTLLNLVSGAKTNVNRLLKSVLKENKIYNEMLKDCKSKIQILHDRLQKRGLPSNNPQDRDDVFYLAFHLLSYCYVLDNLIQLMEYDANINLTLSNLTTQVFSIYQEFNVMYDFLKH